MPGQHRTGEVVEAARACLAAIPLSVRLGLVKAVSHHGSAAAGRTTHPLRPALLPHQGEALGVVDQRREVDQIRCGHGDRGSSHGPVGYPVPHPPHHRGSSGTLPRPGFVTPDPNKSDLNIHGGMDVLLFALAHPRWEFVFQPKYAAYLNLIEPWWMVLRSLA